MRVRIAVFIAIIQSILFAIHYFIFATWSTFRLQADPPGINGLQVAVAALSVSFVAASVLAFRYFNVVVRVFYRLAAAWLGAVNFLFLAACLCWAIYLGAGLAGFHLERSVVAAVTFALALLASIYGTLNARWIRLKRIQIALPNLPPSWRGRAAALVSDVHLGHVNALGFMRRIVARLARLKPDIVFLTGDLFDGTKINAAEVAAPWKDLSPAHGTYFVTGNHEEFSNTTRYLDAVRGCGVRVLKNEKVTVDGLQLVGVGYHDSGDVERFRSILENAALERAQASILLSHSPHALSIPEKAGISLQLSGHTHGGQVFPFTWITRRIFGRYVYGLQRFGEMLVYTTTGVGTWGPPMRVGANPEIVWIEFA